MGKIIFFIIFLLLGPVHQHLFLVCQAGPAPGLKYFKNYRPDKGHDFQPQNWAVIQDKRGIIYIGNQGGLLEFDGVSWRLIQVPNQSVRSLAMDDTGTIYIGGENEIGFLSPDKNGAMQYVSLVEYLKDDKKNFSKIWHTYANREGIYFMAYKYLFRWDRNLKRINVWEPSYFFRAAFMCNGRLFIHQRNVGLMEMKGDSLELLRGGEAFAEAKVDMLVPFDSQNLLVGTRPTGFYLYDGISARHFPTEADDYLEENQLYYGTQLTGSPGEFAVATLRGGLVIIDSQGRLKQIFNKASGLQDNSVVNIFEDPRGNLWLALSKGISMIEYASPISFYDDGADLPGIALSILVETHKDRSILFTGTTHGLFYLASSDKFRPVPGMSSMCWSLLSIGDCFLAAATNGIFQVETGSNNEPGPVRQVIAGPSYVLYRSLSEPDRIWAGTAYGLVSLRVSPQTQNQCRQMSEEHKFEHITEAIKTIAEDKKGNLWLGTLNRGVIKVEFPVPDKTRYVLSRYDESHGLPAGNVNVVAAVGHVMFTTDKGIFCFDEEKKRFIPDITLGKTFAGGGEPVFRIAEDKQRNIWFHSRCLNFQAVLGAEGTYEINSRPFLRIPLAQVNSIYHDPDGKITWFAGVDGLVRFDSTVKKDNTPDFSSYIRSVLINGRHPVIDGFPGQAAIMEPDGPPIGASIVPELVYRDRNIGFRFAAPFFENESATRYQVLLEGYDQTWSDWSIETRKDYTNLDPGLYTFRVRAKNVYDHISREDRYSFRVLAPWYRKWWAYLFYCVFFSLAVYFIVRWRLWKLRQEKQQLEQVVQDRTKEIEEKNRRLKSQTGQLEKQTLQLKKQSLQLEELDRVKSRFFANISHEFRTPLTLIMGPLEKLLSRRSDSDRELENQINLALRNSRRLLSLINQLLDLSKLEGGKMKLQASRQDVIPFLKGIVSSFDSLVVQRQLDLTFQSQEHSIILYFDPEKLEKIITNLITNAIKFTPPQGKITVTVTNQTLLPKIGGPGGETTRFLEKSPPGRRRQPNEYIKISIKDTGIGIPEQELPHIFDRFYQADNSLPPGHKQDGFGIGLALSRELVLLHHGEIDVSSTKDRGTTFTIRLPLGNQHLEPDEITASQEFFPVQPKPCEKPLPDLLEPETDSEEIPGEITGDSSGDTEDQKYIILVVDDNIDMRKYIRNALEPFYQVQEAANGEQGLDKAREIIPDLIISDIMMPGIDGYELCRQLKKSMDTSHIPVILLTARASEESVVKGLETGADDYITKPFSTRILNARIKNLIDLRRQMHRDMNREMTLQPTKISMSLMDREFLNELTRMIEKNLSDPDFNVEALGKKLIMSRATLYRKILALTGETPALYLQAHRLKRAAHLLRNNFGSVTEVAFEVGFSSRAYFTKCFKEKFHRLPSEFQDSEI